MHFLTSLIIFAGFVFVICLGLIHVIFELSNIGAHASPHMLTVTHSKTGGEENGRANTNESSSAADLRETS